VPFAAQTDHRIKAVATVSAVEIGDLFSRGLGRTQGPDALDAVTTAGQLRTAEAKGAEPTYETYVPSSPDGLEDAPSCIARATPTTGPRAASTRARRTSGWFIIDGGTLYDLDEYVTPAVAKITEFVGHHLAA
jgi:hypothetical protein